DGHSQSAVWGDYDNDGWLDLYVATAFGEPNRLFHNNGDGTFEDVSQKSGTNNTARTQCAIWADLDNDGWLDLYLGNFLPAKNALYHNNGDGTFTDVALQAGAGESTFAMAVIPGDFDNDFDTDLYLTHDSNIPYTLLRNDGTGHFENVASAAGVAFAGQGMGADFGDYDNDGWLDLYVTNLKGNVLYRNQGDGTFKNVTYQAKVGDRGMAWSTFFADFNLDGWLDLYVVKESTYSTPPLPNIMYANQGDGTFRVIFAGEGVSSMGSAIGGACADVNNDGAVDFFVANRPGQNFKGNHLFINNAPAHAWLKIKLVGRESNRSAIGARIRLLAGGQWQTRFIAGGSGYASQNSLVQVFGLGEAQQADSLVIYWPSGRIDRMGEITARQTLTLQEGEILTAVKHGPAARVARSWTLGRGYPNPFTLNHDHGVTWRLQLAKPGRVHAAVYNLLGQKVADLLQQRLPAGSKILRWEGRDRSGRLVPTGLYFLRVSWNHSQQIRKILIRRGETHTPGF
ncbi:MAG: T9SS C-terminal target domain-containing protein, partial [Calditrichaeota bacterium]